MSDAPDLDEQPWLSLRIEPSVEKQIVIDALFGAGSLGVHEDGVAIVTHFAPGTDIGVIAGAIREIDAAAGITTGFAPKVDWSEWRASVASHHLGRIVIEPPWFESNGPDSLRVVIDPAMAFGTGEHATTRGVVRLMQQLHPMPTTVADLGAGSAVLAICAAKLGAKRAIAIELDHDAIGNAEENVEANGVSDSVTVIEGDAALLLPLVAPVQLVLANIISSVLLEILPVIHAGLAPGGHAILSGILLEERSLMIEALPNSDWNVISEDSEEAWWSVLIARRP